MINPRIKTPSVCVIVTMAPSRMACFAVPLVPTKYAPTTVLPCPGERAWNAPRLKATMSANRMMLVLSSDWDSNCTRRCCSVRVIESLFRKRAMLPGESPFPEETPPPEDNPTDGVPILNRIDAVRFWGEGMAGSSGYTLSSLVLSLVGTVASTNSIPSPGVATISFHPCRPSKFLSSYSRIMGSSKEPRGISARYLTVIFMVGKLYPPGIKSSD